MDSIDSGYGQEFSGIKGIIAHQIDNLIEITGSEILKKGEAVTKADEKEGQDYDIVKEINEMAEGTLLVVLHSSDTQPSTANMSARRYPRPRRYSGPRS